MLEQTRSLAASTASEQDTKGFSTAHARLTEKFDGLASQVVNFTDSPQGTPNTSMVSHADSACYNRTLRDQSREASRIIKAANGDLGELHEITEAGRAVGIGDDILAMIRTAVHLAKEQIVTTLEGVRSEIIGRQRDARRVERALSARGADLVITDLAPGEFQITTPVSGCGSPNTEEQESSQPAKDVERLELRRELDDVIAAREVAERSKASEVALRAMKFLTRLDAVCEGGIVSAIVSGRIFDVVPFIGNRRIERRIADHAVTLASYAKREEELSVMLRDSAVLSA